MMQTGIELPRGPRARRGQIMPLIRPTFIMSKDLVLHLQHDQEDGGGSKRDRDRISLVPETAGILTAQPCGNLLYHRRVMTQSPVRVMAPDRAAASLRWHPACAPRATPVPSRPIDCQDTPPCPLPV